MEMTDYEKLGQIWDDALDEIFGKEDSESKTDKPDVEVKIYWDDQYGNWTQYHHLTDGDVDIDSEKNWMTINDLDGHVNLINLDNVRRIEAWLN